MSSINFIKNNISYGIVIFLAILCTNSFSTFGQTVSFANSESCLGNQTTFAGSSNLPDGDISQWLWDLDNDGEFDDATGKTHFFLFTQPDSFLVGLKIITTTGTMDSTIQTVVVHPLPDVNFTVDNLCEGKAALYSDASSIEWGSIDQYLWDFNNDGQPDDNSGPVVNYTCGPAATYQTRLTCVSLAGCTSFAVKTTQVFNQPVASFTYDGICENEGTNFTNSSSLNNESFSHHNWTFGDGDELTSTGGPTHTYDSVGSFNVSLIVVSENFCSDTMIQTVDIMGLPQLSIEFSGDTILYNGDNIDIMVNVEGLNYSWSTGESTRFINVTSTGTYDVSVTDINGCSQTLTQALNFLEVNKVEIKGNLMTPNGDGINDYFEIKDLGAFQQCEIGIYNRWNQQVFSSNNYQNDFDGTFGGKELDAGTYFYKINCDSNEEIIGSLNILH